MQSPVANMQKLSFQSVLNTWLIRVIMAASTEEIMQTSFVDFVRYILSLDSLMILISKKGNENEMLIFPCWNTT